MEANHQDNNGGTHKVNFYPIEYKDEIIYEIRKLLNEKKK